MNTHRPLCRPVVVAAALLGLAGLHVVSRECRAAGAAAADTPSPGAAHEPQPVVTAAVKPPAELPPAVALDPAVAGGAGGGTSAPPALVSGSTLAILAAACLALVVSRIAGRRRAASLPPDVFDVLGTASLGGVHAVRIVRFGPKTLLVAVSAAGCQTLAELADPQATACIVAACRGAHPARGPRPGSVAGRAAAVLLAVMLALGGPAAAADAEPAAPEPPPAVGAAPAAPAWADLVPRLFGARSLDAAVPAAVVFGVASLAPAVLLMTTSFVRMSVVLSLLRQGLGTQHLPSNQIVTSLALFLSALGMWPVWTQAWRAGVEPYQDGRISLREAYEQGTLPVRRWMAGQIEQAGNRDTMLLFLARHPDAPRDVKTYDDVPVESLLPAFLVSELETAFAIGFRLLLPFLVLDIVVATLVVSTGLVMLPPTLVSLPLKLLVFVMADGWSLVVQALLDSVRAVAT